LAASLHALIATELAEPVDPRVADMAAAIAARYGDAAQAVLFYGSCLRQRELGGLMLDFYLIVSDYREAYGRGWLAFANRMIPPNVFPFEHRGLVAKYAVLSEADFARECGIEARSISVWARFAQPSRLVWVKDEAARSRTLASVALAAPTLFALTRPTMAEGRAGRLPTGSPMRRWKGSGASCRRGSSRRPWRRGRRSSHRRRRPTPGSTCATACACVTSKRCSAPRSAPPRGASCTSTGSSGPSSFDGIVDGGTLPFQSAHGSFHAAVMSNGDLEVIGEIDQ